MLPQHRRDPAGLVNRGLLQLSSADRGIFGLLLLFLKANQLVSESLAMASEFAQGEHIFLLEAKQGAELAVEKPLLELRSVAQLFVEAGEAEERLLQLLNLRQLTADLERLQRVPQLVRRLCNPCNQVAQFRKGLDEHVVVERQLLAELQELADAVG